MYGLYDTIPFFKGRKTKILKSVSPQVKKDILKAYDEMLRLSICDKYTLNDNLQEFISSGNGLKICTCSSYYGIEGICDEFDNCKQCMKYTKAVITRYIEQPGNEKYLPLIKRRKKDDDVK